MTTTLYLPRRHRRPLLFPPGLLALAWLLWLGCAALPQMVKTERIMQLLMPASNNPIHQRQMYPIYASANEVKRFRPWKTFAFTGNELSDFFVLQSIHAAALHLKEDSTQSRGLRIQFANNAKYSSLVHTLDEFERTVPYQRWLDIKHNPATFYTYTISPRQADYGSKCDYSVAHDWLTMPWYKRLQYRLLNKFGFAGWQQDFLSEWQICYFFILLFGLIAGRKLRLQYHTS